MWSGRTLSRGLQAGGGLLENEVSVGAAEAEGADASQGAAWRRSGHAVSARGTRSRSSSQGMCGLGVSK